MRPKCNQLRPMKIRARTRRIAGRVYRDFVVDFGLVLAADGSRKRKARVCKTREEAERVLGEARGARREHGAAALALAHDVALRYAAVEKRLAAVGASIEQAADFYLSQNRPLKAVVSLGDLLDRCVLDMELRGVASNTISTFVCACRSFAAGREARELGTITREEVRAWVYGNGWHPKTMRGYMGCIVQLFVFAVEEGFLSVSPLAPDVRSGKRKAAIKLPKLVKKEPRIFTPEQVERLFRTAESRCEMGEDVVSGARGRLPVYRRLLGYLALATFGGVRPFELTRLEVAALDLEAGIVALDAAVTKMADRRIVKLTPNCVAWLRVWRAEFPGYRVFAPPSWDRLMKQLRKVAGLSPWPHDVLRHCFASYFHATHGDKRLLQNQLGHSQSEDTLDKYYRAVRGADGRPVTAELAAAVWGVFPTCKK